MPQYFGKYEGVVDENFDPLGKGRLLVKVPAVFRDGKVWALPCVPYAGPNLGFFMMPPTDAHVWVEFAGGDPNRAIWSGCFWGDGESPPVSMSPIAEKKKMVKTDTCTLTMDDTPGAGGITIETTNGQKIKLSATGIEIDNGMGATIKLSGPMVKINESALEVM
jgi:uncharacterized protein involved in type VI secretion and phage assembly